MNVNRKGFTNYLSSKDLKLEDLIVKYEGYEVFIFCPQSDSIIRPSY
jgi:hypothetical protein